MKFAVGAELAAQCGNAVLVGGGFDCSCPPIQPVFFVPCT